MEIGLERELRGVDEGVGRRHDPEKGRCHHQAKRAIRVHRRPVGHDHHIGHQDPCHQIQVGH